MARTIKELAEICGVSEQSVRAWCRRNKIEKQRLDGRKPGYMLDDDTEAKMMRHFSEEPQEDETEASETIESNETKATKASKAGNESIESENADRAKATKVTSESIETNKTKASKPRNESIESAESNEKMVFALLEQLAEKDRQLAAKDDQIKSLTDQAMALTNALASAQEAQTRLTESLAAEQALHAGTIRKQLTMQPQNDEKPRGLFSKLFGRKKKDAGHTGDAPAEP